jgi:NAD(P)-dependent dehydrogenase (short-subunit alcohol dehydrogenase family)
MTMFSGGNFMTQAQTVLITGASSGFGKATAQRFLDRGWNVIPSMRKPDASLFKGNSDRLLVLPLDVTNLESIRSALEEGIRTFGQIDVVVNNAGIGLLSAFEVTPEHILHEVFETNTFGVMNVCRAVIPHMREQGHGTIINVTSSTGIAPMPLVAIYAASKCAVEGFTESLSYEMELVGIRMRLVEPGFAPSTNLTANGGVRMQGLTPPPYSEFAQAYFARMQNYPTDYSTEQDIVEAVFAAATDRGDHLRYLAGPDTKLLASLRWTTSEEKYLAEMREMFRPVPTS